MNKNKDTGRLGEGIAAEWLQGEGYRILHMNWRQGRWEIDIIAERSGVLHFIEVKTRRSLKYGHPENHVNKHKMRNLVNASAGFLLLHPQWMRIQFDIISINLWQESEPDLFLIEDIYYY